jgi:hypothetical protein
MKFKLPEKLLLILLISTLSACKKDKTPITIQSNVWERKEIFGSSYIYFLSNGNVSQFTSFLYNYHAKSYGHYSSTDGQVELTTSPGSNVTLYNITISGDTLYLEDGANITYYTKATTPPDTTNWVRSVTLSERHLLGHFGQYGSVETDGTDLFIRTYSSTKRLYRFSMATHQIEDSVTLVQSGSGTGYVGGGLWINDLSASPYRLFKYNYVAASVVNNSPVLTNNAFAMTGSGGKVWLLTTNMELQTFDPVTNTFETKASFPYLQYFLVGGGYLDIALDGNTLYFSSYQGLMAMDLTTNTFTTTYFKPNTFFTGITKLNGELWATVIETQDGSSSISNATISVSKITLN